MPYGPIHQAACEIVYRSVTEDDVDPTGVGLGKQTPHLGHAVRAVIDTSSRSALGHLLVWGLRTRGRIPGGFTMRWPKDVPEGRELPILPANVTAEGGVG